MKNNTKKPNGIPLDIAIGFIMLFMFLVMTLLFIIGAIQDKRDRLNNENLIEEKMSTKTIIYPEVEKISRRITFDNKKCMGFRSSNLSTYIELN